MGFDRDTISGGNAGRLQLVGPLIDAPLEFADTPASTVKPYAKSASGLKTIQKAFESASFRHSHDDLPFGISLALSRPHSNFSGTQVSGDYGWVLHDGTWGPVRNYAAKIEYYYTVTQFRHEPDIVLDDDLR